MLESVEGLVIPHVHLRTDFARDEIEYLMDRFGTEVFNIHPAASAHPYADVPADLADRFYVENVNVPVAPSDLTGLAGICPDYAHLEDAILHGRSAYVRPTMAQLRHNRIGCCHVSAIRVGDPNTWNGGWDHHRMQSLEDLNYMSRFRSWLPDRWVSIELENPLCDQVEAVGHLTAILKAEESSAPGHHEGSPDSGSDSDNTLRASSSIADRFRP